MSLNIKNEHTHWLARELTELTGESQTYAVTSAVEDKLAALRQPQGDGMAYRMLAIGHEMSVRLNEPYKSAAHGDLLYDENGLPA